MTKVHRRKRIFYLPGLISLLGLPIVLWHFYGIQYKQANQRVIRIVWTNEYQMELMQKDIPLSPYSIWDSIQGFHPKRTLELITLTGDELYDQVKLNYFQIRMREIITSNDSVNGLQIHFTPATSYNSVVKTLDICKIEDAKIYWPHNNNLYFWHEPPNWLFDGLSHCVIIDYPQEIDSRNAFEKLQDKIEPILSEFWHILTGFLILCILGFLYLRQTFR